jgi:hypothetical protein
MEDYEKDVQREFLEAEGTVVPEKNEEKIRIERVRG